jgi:thymidine kinase
MQQHRSTPVARSSDLLRLSEGIQVVAIDEAQFFDEDLPA